MSYIGVHLEVCGVIPFNWDNTSLVVVSGDGRKCLRPRFDQGRLLLFPYCRASVQTVLHAGAGL